MQGPSEAVEKGPIHAAIKVVRALSNEDCLIEQDMDGCHGSGGLAPPRQARTALALWSRDTIS